jgi:outer membrane protein assembly factor BamD
MKKRPTIHTLRLTLTLLVVAMLTACTPYAKVQKTMNVQYKYEAAKAYFIEGKYDRAAELLEDVNAFMKGSASGEECLYMLAMSYFNQKDYISASTYLQTYATSYPRGLYAEQARYHAIIALYRDTPDPRLDQSSTARAIEEIQLFNEYYPYSRYRAQVEDILYTLYDRLVEKEYRSAQLYYNLGNYMGNNYQACIITAQNAMRDYPYTKYREELSFLILKAKYTMARESVKDKMLDRYRDAIDEYYAFKNEFPESTRLKEATSMFNDAERAIKRL